VRARTAWAALVAAAALTAGPAQAATEELSID
jgi:hypothetical protein